MRTTRLCRHETTQLSAHAWTEAELAPWVAAPVYFRIRDNSSGGWGHLALDNLRYYGTPLEAEEHAGVAAAGDSAPFRPLRFGLLVATSVLALVMLNHCIARKPAEQAGEHGDEADRRRREVQRRIREQQQVRRLGVSPFERCATACRFATMSTDDMHSRSMCVLAGWKHACTCMHAIKTCLHARAR